MSDREKVVSWVLGGTRTTYLQHHSTASFAIRTHQAVLQYLYQHAIIEIILFYFKVSGGWYSPSKAMKVVLQRSLERIPRGIRVGLNSWGIATCTKGDFSCLRWRFLHVTGGGGLYLWNKSALMCIPVL